MNIKYDEKGLVPAVAQDAATGEILMVAYMNEEALHATIKTGRAVFWSRSRQKLWTKGETSGHYLDVKEIRVDCDEDCIVLRVIPHGPACHTENRSCFYRRLDKNGELVEDTDPIFMRDTIMREQAVVLDRKNNPEEGSYTNYLFSKGEDKILKKVGEEAAEVVIAGKNRDKDEIKYETADLMYHLTVMLADNDMTWEDVYEEMEKRRK